MKRKQPTRAATDGAVEVSRVGGLITIYCCTNGVDGEVVLGEYNAWRALALLSVLLGVKLPADVRIEL